MTNLKPPSAAGTDWTRLLSDPDLVSHLGRLLQAYREAPAEKREEVLLRTMREIKNKSAGERSQPDAGSKPSIPPAPVATEPAATPPFQPDIFTPSWGLDRRRYPRIKCFVAVELRMDGVDAPIWGNLSNTSMGGCYVETASPVKPGASVEIGLWVANGKIWVKGIAFNGVVTKSNPSFGIRVKFEDMEPTQRESLREFLKFVESTTKGYNVEHGYLGRLKR
jgi:hypothetical protein